MSPEEFDAAFAAEERIARRVASTIGPMSAAAQALALLERRRAAGENAFICDDGRGSWVVGVRAAAELGRKGEGS